MIRALLMVLLVLLIIGLFPAWPYSANFGYVPSGGLLLVFVVLALLLYGRRGDLL